MSLIEVWKQEIERDLEYLRKTFNQPVKREYEYGDGSGVRGMITIWTLACPDCFYKGEINTVEKPDCPQCGKRMKIYSV